MFDRGWQNRRPWLARAIFLSLVAGLVLLFQAPSGRTNAADVPTSNGTVRLSPGLTLTFETGNGAVDATNARLVALRVPAGTPVSPFIPIGAFKATWTGMFTTRIKDSYRFSAEGFGDLSITVNDKPVLELHGDLKSQLSPAMVLKKGKNRLVVIYRSPAAGDANVRLLWAPSGKPFEPMPPTIFSHDADAEMLVQHAKLRAGRELFATMRCMNCHQGVSGSMPELKQDAPNLSDLRGRLNPTWVAFWISNPKALRPTASMPRVFHDLAEAPRSDADPRAIDISAYLCGPVETTPTVVVDPAVLARGARLFTGLGCVACHVAPGIDDSDPTLNRVPLNYVKAKFAGQSLDRFLKSPEAHYAWIKMPNFHLSDDESSALSAWLLSRCNDRALPAVARPGDPENGKKLFESTGCLNCHAIGDATAKPLLALDLKQADWTQGCLADGGKGVKFNFTADQKESLRAFAAIEWKPTLDRDPLPEFASRQMIASRCNACHSIDSADDAWSNLDGEIGAIEQNLPPRPENDPEPQGDQSRPPLTWAGEKFRPSWMASFVAGNVSYKPRPWLLARMPSFASRAELLARGMAMAHGCPMNDEVRPPVNSHLVDIGRSLTAQTSFGCVKCHSCGDQPALAPFEASAPNLAHVTDRLRHEYYSHWMRNPQYYVPGTKMPSFADAEGNTAYKDILKGVAADQYEAIWQYLMAGDKIVPPQ